MPSLQRHPTLLYLYMGLFVSALSLVAGVVYESLPMLIYALLVGALCALGCWLILRRD